jgi:hypothetical protein
VSEIDQVNELQWLIDSDDNILDASIAMIVVNRKEESGIAIMVGRQDGWATEIAFSKSDIKRMLAILDY